MQKLSDNSIPTRKMFQAEVQVTAAESAVPLCDRLKGIWSGSHLLQGAQQVGVEGQGPEGDFADSEGRQGSYPPCLANPGSLYGCTGLDFCCQCASWSKTAGSSRQKLPKGFQTTQSALAKLIE